MLKTWQIWKKTIGVGLLFAGVLVINSARAQQAATDTAPHRTRLILKDGSYQIVMSYRVQGDRVLIVSAERAGATEEIPVALVDFEATHRWEQRHAPVGDASQAPPPTIDPELAKEEEERRSLTPEVAPDLRLPEQDSALALDIFRDVPELVPLVQSSGDLNQTTGHSVVRSVLNPMATSHQIVQLRGEKAVAQLHVNQPSLYLRLGDDSGIRTGGTPLTVDTHGASAAQVGRGNSSGGSPESQYVVVRVDVRQGARVVASFNINQLGQVRQQEDVVETMTEILPGGHWMRVTPRAPLSFGEYALMEIISPKEINLGVWDFGVHPTSPDNRDALKPEPKRPAALERRGPE
ncbi:hypothetical protein [Granulicella arctica]|uniref:hypothetical protein n=1 Tax=Granulicella arctica TaxID=940613 RepID=UPI0021E0E627|nr:hypothetical protein [Granulicella arctica]